VKRLLTLVLTLAVFCTTALAGQTPPSQDMTGTWQGSLQLPDGKALRTVLKITRGDGGALKANFYSIDQGGQPMPVSSIALQGSAFTFAISAIEGKYEGKLSPDGNTVTGEWTQGPNPLPLVLTRATKASEWNIPEPPPKLPPMAATADPEFEVATIKPSKPDQQGKGFMVKGREFDTINTSLIDLITFAYGIHPKQIVGAPDWAGTDKYDLTAKPDGEGQPNDRQWKTMIQKLLADRFKFAFHHDKKELSVYTLVVAKGGSKMTKSEGDPNGLPALFFHGLGDLPGRNATMADFAGVMQTAVLDRPVVDQTGLTGRFDFTLKWSPDESQFGGLGIKVPPPSDKPDAPPNLYQAIQEQMALKLDPVKAPADVLVIDHVDKPSAN
jgi:uncharacterized protein (TIGR03435 family)